MNLCKFMRLSVERERSPIIYNLRRIKNFTASILIIFIEKSAYINLLIGNSYNLIGLESLWDLDLEVYSGEFFFIHVFKFALFDDKKRPAFSQIPIHYQKSNSRIS